MKHNSSYRNLAVILAVVLIAGLAFVGSAHADQTQAVGTAFPYQGKLYDGDSPASGTYDFQFTLFGQETGGSAIAGPITRGDVDVNEGLFTASLDFGANAFDGNPRWLEVAVRAGSSTGGYTTLVPRQSLAPTPYAIYAGSVDWTGVKNVPSDLADGDQNTTYTAGTNLKLTGTQFSLADHLNIPGLAVPGTTVVQEGDIYRNNQILAWAKVMEGGELSGDHFDFGVDHISHIGVGHYEVFLDVSVPDGGFLAPVASPEVDWTDDFVNTPSAGNLRIAVVDQLGLTGTASNRFGVYMFDGTGTLVDNDFIVIVTGGGEFQN